MRHLLRFLRDLTSGHRDLTSRAMTNHHDDFGYATRKDTNQ